MADNNQLYDDIVAWWKSLKIETPQQLEAYLDSFAVLFSYHSGAIENRAITYHDTHEIFEHGRVVNFTGDLKTLFEIENLKRAYELMIAWFDLNQPLTQEAIKQMHKVLTQGTYDERRWELGERPGTYKKNDIWGVGPHDLAAPVADVEVEIAEIIEQLDGVKEDQALTAAAWFHLKFESIHAFADGNGRVGRALMNYFLVQHNHPPIIVHEQDRKGYYGALEAFDRSGDIEPMKAFLKQETCKTWQSAFGRYERSKS